MMLPYLDTNGNLQNPKLKLKILIYHFIISDFNQSDFFRNKVEEETYNTLVSYLHNYYDKFEVIVRTFNYDGKALYHILIEITVYENGKSIKLKDIVKVQDFEILFNTRHIDELRHYIKVDYPVPQQVSIIHQ
jgi:hypothetical protein